MFSFRAVVRLFDRLIVWVLRCVCVGQRLAAAYLLRTSPLHKIGHALHDLDPVLKKYSYENRVGQVRNEVCTSLTFAKTRREVAIFLVFVKRKRPVVTKKGGLLVQRQT